MERSVGQGLGSDVLVAKSTADHENWLVSSLPLSGVFFFRVVDDDDSGFGSTCVDSNMYSDTALLTLAACV